MGNEFKDMFLFIFYTFMIFFYTNNIYVLFCVNIFNTASVFCFAKSTFSSRGRLTSA